MTPTQTATLTIEPTQTASPPSNALPSPETIAFPSPTSPQVNCEYTVQSGDNVTEISEKFQTTPDQVFRQDDSQENLDQIYPGEVLIIKNILSEVCVNGGGNIQPQSLSTTP